jgi:hypothetical protein
MTATNGARAAALALMALTGACASSDKPAPSVTQPEAPPRVDRSDQVRRGVADAATMPLRDVGLIRPDIPAPLAGLTYPYESQRLLAGCSQVLYEIGQLDAALGVETYQPAEQRRLMQRGADAAVGGAVGVARDAAGDVIPFRGWVRRASGAAKAEKEVAQAIEMGQTRRAFLRGYGAAIGCMNVVPAPPPPDENAAVDPRTPPPGGRDVRSPR